MSTSSGTIAHPIAHATASEGTRWGQLFFGIVCIVVWLSIQGRLRNAYLGYDLDVQNLWESPPPSGT